MQPRPLQGMGRLSGGGDAHMPVDATGPSLFHNAMLSRACVPADCVLTHPSKCS